MRRARVPKVPDGQEMLREGGLCKERGRHRDVQERKQSVRVGALQDDRRARDVHVYPNEESDYVPDGIPFAKAFDCTDTAAYARAVGRTEPGALAEALARAVRGAVTVTKRKAVARAEPDPKLTAN